MDTNKIVTYQQEMSPCHYKMAISVPPDEVKSTLADVERKFTHHVRVPGFRVGKTPKNLVKKRFIHKIREEAKNELLKIALETAITRCDPEPVTLPTFLEGKSPELNENDGFNFTVEFDVAPTFDLPEYKGIKLKCSEPTVQEQDVERVVEDIRGQRPSYEKADRPSQENDMVKVSYVADGIDISEVPDDAHPLVHNEETWLLLSQPEIIPGTITGLQGKAAGDQLPLQVSFPAEYREKFLAGKTLNYTFTIHEVHARILPELNDEFAGLFGMKSMTELRASISDKLKSELETEKKLTLRQQIHDFLQEGTNFSLPPRVLEAEKQYVFYSTAEAWAKQGKSIDQIKEEKGVFDREMEEKASKRLKLRYIMGEIAKREKINVTDEEIEHFLEIMDNQMDRNPRHYSKKPDRDVLKSNIKWNLLMDRVTDKLIEYGEVSINDN